MTTSLIPTIISRCIGTWFETVAEGVIRALPVILVVMVVGPGKVPGAVRAAWRWEFGAQQGRSEHISYYSLGSGPIKCFAVWGSEKGTTVTLKEEADVSQYEDRDGWLCTAYSRYPARNLTASHGQQPVRARDTSAYMRAMYCDIGEPAEGAEARWCERYRQYLRTHPHASGESAMTAASGGHLDSVTVVRLREEAASWRSYCARTYGRPGEYEPYQRECRKRGLAR